MLALSKIKNPSPEDSNTRQETNPLPNLFEGYLKKEDLAKCLGVSPRTVDRWEALKVGPPRVVVVGFVLYDINSVKAWLKSREKVGARARKPRTKKRPQEKTAMNLEAEQTTQ